MTMQVKVLTRPVADASYVRAMLSGLARTLKHRMQQQQQQEHYQ